MREPGQSGSEQSLSLCQKHFKVKHYITLDQDISLMSEKYSFKDWRLVHDVLTLTKMAPGNASVATVLIEDAEDVLLVMFLL